MSIVFEATDDYYNRKLKIFIPKGGHVIKLKEFRNTVNVQLMNKAQINIRTKQFKRYFEEIKNERALEEILQNNKKRNISSKTNARKKNQKNDKRLG